jgi:hypothetical protein
MSDYEKVLEYLRQRCLEVRGEWNGDEPGQLEDDANTATELLKLLDEVDQLVKKLDI